MWPFEPARRRKLSQIAIFLPRPVAFRRMPMGAKGARSWLIDMNGVDVPDDAIEAGYTLSDLDDAYLALIRRLTTRPLAGAGSTRAAGS